MRLLERLEAAVVTKCVYLCRVFIRSLGFRGFSSSCFLSQAQHTNGVSNKCWPAITWPDAVIGGAQARPSLLSWGSQAPASFVGKEEKKCCLNICARQLVNHDLNAVCFSVLMYVHVQFCSTLWPETQLPVWHHALSSFVFFPTCALRARCTLAALPLQLGLLHVLRFPCVSCQEGLVPPALLLTVSELRHILLTWKRHLSSSHGSGCPLASRSAPCVGPCL